MDKVKFVQKISCRDFLFRHACFFMDIHKDSDMVLNSFLLGLSVSGVIKYALLHPAAQSVKGV